jgi:hypothetical protein
MDSLTTEQLILELETVIAELKAGERFSLHRHPALPLMLLEPLNDGPTIPAVENDSFERLIEGPGQKISGLIAEAMAALDVGPLKEIASKYAATFREYLTRRAALIAAQGDA